MIYACQTKYSHYLFYASQREAACPDCGKKQIRPATRGERTEFFRLRTEFLPVGKRSG